ncbi:hypothetical protein HTZ77_17100 [Nonomuraea sp. SMC257]|uniref:Uncharacterized protein n=1 Tax=Nonomuraea montanisoli TaxID=2741721 RepID=A0A7Y6M428_9ACTN|nr:hypothetical protein [Nonomuraea montanisoli]NUW33136.1 hypothetical protein [Nonomuraea montanisoli]
MAPSDDLSDGHHAAYGLGHDREALARRPGPLLDGVACLLGGPSSLLGGVAERLGCGP